MEENDLSTIPLYVVKWDVVMGTANYTIEKMYNSCTQPEYVTAHSEIYPGLHSPHETDLMGYTTSSYHLSRCLAMLHKVLGMETIIMNEDILRLNSSLHISLPYLNQRRPAYWAERRVIK